ncbi:NAD(P)H-dependent glycerol-3-phosphate dehydrogenase [Promicromonospora thailandica]|uniref:Glycerol-3-phosphate dehydrogenase [NAD(P)+] n=1 Tax=Promicromonospora thailandica TaxID=765201 RepID=A0A9X2JUT4_9MICO|nr:NAD(P)H-dependent glycerol-3-phosphate dehydrogenase [Promicromonospora thailandica]MCP2264346.1 glycerol-3-phosphate dehydrogenase (NAD(P)+) [Promicromonospora thailandica]BFF20963.1 NAD(P)H-dependent glycerol-3-phosphate dehydrogenase [Promicromonospora thailandica]
MSAAAQNQGAAAQTQPRVAVLGAGSMGTTFAMVLADAGCDVTLWGRDAAVLDAVDRTHRNEKYLPGIQLPAMRGTTDAAVALKGASIVVVSVPSQVSRATLESMKDLVEPDAVVVSLMKGVELGTDKRMSQVMAEVLELPDERVAVVSGPNLAPEIAARQPTATVVASRSEATAQLVAAACSTGYFRPYTNTDVVGVELCGAVKNIIALAAGMAQGRGFGWNTLATVITRGLVEITRLGLAVGAEPTTFAGLAGMGDLMATCASPLSRNHRLGKHLGEGLTLTEAIEATGGTAEGVKSSQSVLELARTHGVEMPITAGVVAVLDGSLPVEELAATLLKRPQKSEAAG